MCEYRRDGGQCRPVQLQRTMRLLLVALGLLAAAASSAADRYHPAPPRGERGAAAAARYADAAELGAAHWYQEAHAALAARLDAQYNERVARNVIMFLGDGLSVPTLFAARTLQGQRAGRPGEEGQLSFEAFPIVGLSKTYCVNAQIADSACTATAYLSGVKNNYGTIGVTATVPRYDCAASADTAAHVESIAAWALRDGRDAGIVTTTRITHASPAGAYAHVADRNWENNALVEEAGADPALCPDIAHQLINSFPGNQFRVIMGGGRRNLTPNNTTDEHGTVGRRTDGRDLVEEWRAAKQAAGASHQYVWTGEQLEAARAAEPDYLLGLFASNHLQYNMEAVASGAPQPSLANMTAAAVELLSRNERGFFLFVEAGRIDHAHHDVQPELALDETLELAAAVTRALELTSREDTLVVLTADHAHVMAVNGYSPRGSDVLGASGDLDDHGVPYQTLSYTNGPGFRAHTEQGTRPNVLEESEYQDMWWRTHVDAPLASETHGGDDVAVFALGPHHQLFSGLYEQSQLPHLMAYAACLGNGPTACSGAAQAAPAATLTALLVAAAAAAAALLRH